MFGRTRAFHVQPLIQDFAADCARLHATAFPHAWDVTEFERLIGAGSSFGEAAVDSRSRKLLGFVLSRRAAEEAEILTVAVHAAFRGQGIGGKLLAVHLPRLGRYGIKQVFLEVGEGNAPALRLYARLGFAEVGRRKGYYRTASGAPATAIVMRCGLE